MSKPIIWLIALALLFPAVASAHQPRLVTGNEPVTVNDPEISKAYYDTLTGGPRVYNIYSPLKFELYLNLLVPQNSNASGRYSARVFSGNYLMETLNDQAVQWVPMWEEYGRDWYVKGPEFKVTLPPGTYRVEVFGNNNVGKYVLAVGEKEVFTPREIISALVAVPKLKRDFFNESGWSFAISRFGAPYLLALLILGALFGLIYRVIHRRVSKISSVTRLGRNLSNSDRQLRLAVAVALLIFGVYVWSVPALFFSGFCFFEAAFSWCGFYAVIGKNSCPV